MFDLNEQLGAWRQSFAGAEAMSSADLDELQQHVRDSVAQLTANGLTQEEAFAIAIRRVGDPGSLVGEFRKVNGNRVWAQRAFWMIVGFLGLQIAGMVTSAIAAICQVVAAYEGGGSLGVVAASLAAYVACWIAISVGISRTSAVYPGSFVAKLVHSPRWMVVAAAAFIAIFAKATQLVAQMVVINNLPLQDYAQSARWAALSNPVLSVLLFALLSITAFRLRQAATQELAT